MSRLAETVEEAADVLRRTGCGFALVGGLAVGARTEPRFTKDVDLAVAVADDAAAEAVVSRFLGRGFEVVSLVEQAAADRLATVRLRRRSADPSEPVVDLLFATSGIEVEIAAAAEPIAVFAGAEIPVAQVGHLIAMKILSRDDRARLQDHVDLQKLRAIADADGRALATTSVRLIAARGFAREKDLVSELAAFLSEPPLR